MKPFIFGKDDETRCGFITELKVDRFQIQHLCLSADFCGQSLRFVQIATGNDQRQFREMKAKQARQLLTCRAVTSNQMERV